MNEKVTTEQKKKISDIRRLGNLNYKMKLDYLRGTYFWAKRDSITSSKLSKRPTYRVIKILERVAEDNEVELFQDFFEWVCLPFSLEDEKNTAVKRFKKTYGDNYPAPRFLLSVQASIDLYITMKLKEYEE